MVTERPFEGQRLLGIDVAFDNDLCLRRNLEIVGQALDEFHRLLTQETGEDKLADAGRQRGRGRVDGRRIAAQSDGDRELLTHLPCLLEVGSAGLVTLPVEANGLLVEALDPVHSGVALAGLRVLSMDHREGYEGSAILGPTSLNW